MIILNKMLPVAQFQRKEQKLRLKEAAKKVPPPVLRPLEHSGHWNFFLVISVKSFKKRSFSFVVRSLPPLPLSGRNTSVETFLRLHLPDMVGSRCLGGGIIFKSLWQIDKITLLGRPANRLTRGIYFLSYHKPSLFQQALFHNRCDICLPPFLSFPPFVIIIINKNNVPFY